VKPVEIISSCGKKKEEQYKPNYFMKGEAEARRPCKEDKNGCQMKQQVP
jgi:hypothetical protein